MTDTMRERGTVVNSAAKMLSSGNVNLDTMPQLILRIINEGMWRQRAIPQRRWALSREFASFEEFVTADPLDGLKTSIQMLRDLCRRDPRAQNAIDQETQRPPGRPPEIMSITHDKRPNSGSQAAALRRLRRERPDLLERVFLPRGDEARLTAHKAMIEAGFAHRTLNIRADDPEHAGRTLRRHYKDPEQIELLVKALTERKD